MAELLAGETRASAKPPLSLGISSVTVCDQGVQASGLELMLAEVRAKIEEASKRLEAAEADRVAAQQDLHQRDEKIQELRNEATRRQSDEKSRIQEEERKAEERRCAEIREQLRKEEEQRQQEENQKKEEEEMALRKKAAEEEKQRQKEEKLRREEELRLQAEEQK